MFLQGSRSGRVNLVNTTLSRGLQGIRNGTSRRNLLYQYPRPTLRRNRLQIPLGSLNLRGRTVRTSKGRMVLPALPAPTRLTEVFWACVDETFLFPRKGIR